MSLDHLLEPGTGDEGWPLAPAHRDRDEWLAVWRNLRAGVMPPAGKPRPAEVERREIVASIERNVFGVDGASPDPGRVVLRRMNRVEYANTVRDLTGHDLDLIDDLPADDTGYGFDTIAEVLTVSPLLLEKYLAAATRVGERVGEARATEFVDGAPAYPPRHRTVFAFGPPPQDTAAAAAHRRRTIERLATRGFRRPPDEATVDRLGAIAASVEQRGGSFEQGMAAAVTAVLSSPRFLFRFEADASNAAKGPAVPIDEFSLATRLSYFLWSTTPDDDLLSLAAAGGLRAHLPDLIDRMIRDPRCDAFIANFVGQWLRTRDIETLPFSLKRIVQAADPEDEKRVQRHFDAKLRPAMRQESEMLVAHVLRSGLPATDLLLGRATFLNADLAAHYGIPGVEGDAMRLVELPAGSRLGGMLAHGSILAVTSTPTRTSPVKRGLFVLDALLGVPPPPTPPDVPALEAAKKRAGDDASVRELLEAHRADAACAACHALMDPVGLALEEYDAIGRWRGEGAAMAGTLLTGEAFADTADLAARIAIDRRRDFHRCLVEKLLIYAIGRGLEVHDSPAIEAIARVALHGAGVVVALPALTSLRGDRAPGPPRRSRVISGGSAVPTRLAVLYVPNGVNLREWRPSGVGHDYRLGRSLAPLEPFRDDLQVITGLAHRAGFSAVGGGAHARAMTTILTGVEPRKTAGADVQAGISFDQVAAATLGDATRFSSLELSCDGVRKSGACDAGYSCAYSFNMSWRSDRQPAVPESNPRLVFERLFGAGRGAERAASLAARLAGQRSVLDFVLDEVRAIEPSLGRDDRRKLDEYLGSVRAIERQLEKFERLQVPPVADHDLPVTEPSVYGTHIRLLADMLVLAFRTDSTRIVTFILAHDGGDRTFPEIGVEDGHHTLSHHRGNRASLEKIARIDRFYAEQLAYVLGRLRDVEEPGGGTLLDHSMVLYASGLSDGNKHRHDDLPVILAGHAGGRLSAGRHVKLPGEQPMANLFLTMLDLMGSKQSRFADSTGPLDQVRA